jgi:hypothetical protein
MKAFYTSYPLGEIIGKRSFSEAAFNEEWLSALKELSNPNSLCIPRFLPTMLKSIFPDQTEARLLKVKDALFHMDDTSALEFFSKNKDYVSWDILTRFINWKRDNLLEIIKRGQLYWDVLKSGKFGIDSYPPPIHEFIHLSVVKSKDLAKQLVLLPIPENIQYLFFMLIFKFYYNHRIEVSKKKDSYLFLSIGEDVRFPIIEKVVKKMFEFIKAIENGGFRLISRYKKTEKISYNSHSLFEKFQVWANILELNSKTYLFLSIAKYYIFFHFIRGDDYTNGMRLEINL